jgi:DNA-binding SARP family transcriptional activator/TolB-like protein/Tfp pilus assembly protein PilF
MLGPFAVSRDGRGLPLPASRKVRGLFAYLALASRPAGRGQLCELLWDVPNDPRSELRWCLSKIRSVIDAPGSQRVIAHEDAVRLDLQDCFVDAIEIERATREGIEALPLERKRALVALFNGDFLEGLDIDRCPAFGGWLTAQRRRFRGCHVALLEQLAQSLPGAEALGYLEKWQQLAPFDRRVHEMLLTTLARSGRIREGEEHLSATIAMFEAEGLDSSSIREAWRRDRVGESRVLPHVVTDAASAESVVEATTAAPRRASIAVMPFLESSAEPQARGGIADALAYDVTTRLAKLRSMFVIAQGSTFALHERRVGPEEAGRMLNVDYVLSGTARLQGARLTITVELIETRTARIVWSEILNRKIDDAFLVLEEIGNKIVASIAAEIETLERNRAILRPPSSLDAWEAHHRGLWHMYRFTKSDNEQARHFFETAVRLDPTFARAYAGLSFTHFQNAFQGWARRSTEVDRAYEAAGQSLMVDERDPAAHWAMGRALWLRGSADQAVLELENAIDLSPNFAQAHYMLAFVQSQIGDAGAAISSSDCSRSLSPFDPLLFAMLGARAMALARLGRYDEAAAWSVKAASRPNAHVHIFAIAAYCCALAGSLDQARGYAAAVRKSVPHYGVTDFLSAFRFDADGEVLFRKGARCVGMQ